MPPRVTRVRHVALACRDADETLRFYRDTLGLTVVADQIDGAGRRTLTLPVGLSALLVIETGEEKGIDHLAFDTDDATLPRAGTTLGPDAHLGLPMRLFPAITPPPAPPGHALNIDHVVIASGDSATVAAHFRDELGLEIKRTMARPGTNSHLEFGKLFDLTLEFAGPPEPRPGPVKGAFWGLVFTVDDIDAVVETVRAAGYPVDDPKPAVQPGAKIAGVKAGTGGVPFALIQYGALSV